MPLQVGIFSFQVSPLQDMCLKTLQKMVADSKLETFAAVTSSFIWTMPKGQY